jgi:hypothetical protein
MCKKKFYIVFGADDTMLPKDFCFRGWRGTNVKPLRSRYQDLLKASPNKINLLCAAGSERGQIDIWEYLS